MRLFAAHCQRQIARKGADLRHLIAFAAPGKDISLQLKRGKRRSDGSDPQPEFPDSLRCNKRPDGSMRGRCLRPSGMNHRLAGQIVRLGPLNRRRNCDERVFQHLIDM